jgi:hypothetical protein
MLNQARTPVAAAHVGRASQLLADLRERFLPELASGAIRVSFIDRPSYAVLAQACASLEVAVDTVNLQLVEPRGLLRRLLRRPPDPALAVLRRQLTDVASRWKDVRGAAASIERSFTACEQAEKRAFLQVGLTVKDFQPQFSQFSEWLDLASQQLPPDNEQLQQMSFDYGHVQLAEARARLLLEELQRLELTRSSLMEMLNIELGRSLNVWEIRTEELLEQCEHGTARTRLPVDLMPKHIALRRLVHKVGATCDQLQHQEETVRDIANELFRPRSVQKLGD